MSLDLVSLAHLPRLEPPASFLGARRLLWKLHLDPGRQAEMLL